PGSCIPCSPWLSVLPVVVRRSARRNANARAWGCLSDRAEALRDPWENPRRCLLSQLRDGCREAVSAHRARRARRNDAVTIDADRAQSGSRYVIPRRYVDARPPALRFRQTPRGFPARWRRRPAAVRPRRRAADGAAGSAARGRWSPAHAVADAGGVRRGVGQRLSARLF